MGLRTWLGLKRKKASTHGRVAESIYKDRIGKLKLDHGSGYDLVRYDHDGSFDYEAYRQIQIAANHIKIGQVFAREENIHFLCEWLRERGGTVASVLCHGTRNGAEQTFFHGALPGAYVIGTEISDTATQFPMTIEWDFHLPRSEWVGAFDLIYSNSWDHSHDPRSMFQVWLDCLSPRGVLALEWTEAHAGNEANPIDPFRATLQGLVAVLESASDRTRFAPPETLSGLPFSEFDNHFVLVCRKPESGAI